MFDTSLAFHPLPLFTAELREGNLGFRGRIFLKGVFSMHAISPFISCFAPVPA